jgi:hypothetical protein
MKIEIIVPIVQDNLFEGFLRSVEANTILPQRILLIDNTLNRQYQVPGSSIEIVKLHSKSGKVNESWNLGIKNASKNCDAVGIYNDDIFLGKHFFRRITETLGSDDRCGVACPHTVPSDQPLKKLKPYITIMGRREGWCFTIKKQVLDMIPPIPDNIIQIWHGDDFIWKFSHKYGYYWAKDLGNLIHHIGGVSVLSTGSRENKKPEWALWQQLVPLIEGRKEFNQK